MQLLFLSITRCHHGATGKSIHGRPKATTKTSNTAEMFGLGSGITNIHKSQDHVFQHAGNHYNA
jgi:hypothetical protein